MQPSTLSRARRAGVGLLLLTCAITAAAEYVMDRIRLREQINIGFRQDSPPFSFVDAQGQPAGYSLELCKGIAEVIAAEVNKPTLQVRFIPVPADQVVRIVSAAGVDLLCAGTSDTEERRRSMSFSPPIFVTHAKFMVRTRDGITSAAQLKGLPVAVVGRTTAEQAVPAYGERQGLNLTISRALTADAALGQLDIGQVKAYARDEILMLSQLAAFPRAGDFTILPDIISTEINAIALPKTDPELQKAVDQGMAMMVRNGRATELYRKWFIQPHAAAPKGLQLAMPRELKAEWDKLR